MGIVMGPTVVGMDGLESRPGEDFNVIGFSFRGPDRLPVRFDSAWDGK
jgi:hypothetical protein